mmetsp:Transcript_18514/g.45881  ORF Transcript_18514/g.45881 Transcript_18514/m.45881 type:complete len:172 (-) Transcript_18514:1625-2140(-)
MREAPLLCSLCSNRLCSIQTHFATGTQYSVFTQIQIHMRWYFCNPCRSVCQLAPMPKENAAQFGVEVLGFLVDIADRDAFGDHVGDFLAMILGVVEGADDGTFVGRALESLVGRVMKDEGALDDVPFGCVLGLSDASIVGVKDGYDDGRAVVSTDDGAGDGITCSLAFCSD